MPSGENQIKESFQKVKEDMQAIKQAINLLSEELELQRNQLEELKRTLIQTQNPTDNPAHQADRQIIPTDNLSLKALKPQNLPFSTGNGGVPTDRQTDRQTDRHIEKVRLTTPSGSQIDPISKIEKVSEILNSLDDIKKDLRTKFKRLTQQEMLVFSVIYQLDEEGLSPDYSLVSIKTNLSESSIRDYVQKLIKKGIPVDKIKQNNKKITLSIPQNIKKIASLNTILTLREL